MPLLKRNPFGHILFLKRLLILFAGFATHARYKRFNTLQIEGSEVLRKLPGKKVLFVSNHQTYFADVVAMFHVFNASLQGRENSIKNALYLLRPKLNLYYIAAKETMNDSLLAKILAYAGSISIERTWRAGGKEVKRQVKFSDISNIGIIFLLYLLGLDLLPQQLWQMLREATVVTLLSSAIFSLIGFAIGFLGLCLPCCSARPPAAYLHFAC